MEVTMRLTGGALLLVVAGLASPAALAQWQLESKDGKSSVRFGLLVQGQYEGVEAEASTGEEFWSQNMFIRRARLLFGGKYEKVSFFLETDSPNVGKWEKSATGTDIGKKNAGSVFLQDAWLTYTQSDALMVDAGLFLLPVSYQTLQSAASLLSIDYGPFSFQDSTPLDERVGRDYAVQLRGYPIGKRLEYRVGAAQGLRNYDLDDEGNALNQNNQPFRVFGRVQYHVFEPQTGFFYTGTNLGEKKMLDLGVSYTKQGDFESISGSVFLDLPVAGNGLTVQADWVDYDGGATLPLVATPPTLGNLGQESVGFVEAGFFVKRAALMPFAQWSRVEYDVPPNDTTLATSQEKLQVGLAWFASGHKVNLKLGYAILGAEKNATDVPDQHQVVLQAQLFYY
jgi:hypothetical protein